MKKTPRAFVEPHIRRELYLDVLAINKIFTPAAPPHGFSTTLVAMAIGVSTIDGSPISVSSVADITELSRRTVKRAISALMDMGYLETVPYSGGPGYVITPLADEVCKTLFAELVKIRPDILRK